ncbi:hypothetical protein Tco_1456913 [Tanacetum coccineum]
MSFMTGTLLNPFQFSLLKRKLTMEEMVNKFIEEGKREHEEMEAFIREFRTTNELLFKERNNSTKRASNTKYTVLLNKLPSKEKYPGSFTIPCDIGNLHIDNALADLGVSISLMPYTMYEKLGRPFLATARAMIDVFNKKITLRVGDDEVTFDIDQSIKRLPVEDDECYKIDDFDETIDLEAQELLEDNQMDSFLVNNLEKCVNQSNLKNYGNSEEPIRRITQVDTAYPKTHETQGSERAQNEHLYSASANEIDEKKPELKELPPHLKYAYLKGNESCPVIISSKLTEKEKKFTFIGFFQIPIAPEDKEKTTFTCPYGTFAYRMMPFGLCNV